MTDPYHLYQTNRDIGGSLAAYGIFNAVRSGDRMLDIGCNEGAYCLAMAERCSEVIGIEPVETTVGPAKAKAPGNCRFIVSPFRCNMIRGERFDAILMLAVISHLEIPGLLARCLSSALNPGGVLIFLSHTLGCDAATDDKTATFCLLAQRFLDLESEELIDCRVLEKNDKQGKEGLHRRLLTFRNTKELEYNGEHWQFHAAGGTSRVFRRGDKVLKLFDVYQRPDAIDQLDRIVAEEADFVRAAAVCPTVHEVGKRHIVMDYCGEQPSRRTWPADWYEQVRCIHDELVRVGRPIGDPALENLLVDEHGRLTLIDPVVIEGVHDPAFTDPAKFSERIAYFVETDLMNQPF